MREVLAFQRASGHAARGRQCDLLVDERGIGALIVDGFPRIAQRSATSTLRTQSVARPHGSAMKKLRSLGITAIGVAYFLPLLRPRCRSTAPQRKEPVAGEANCDLVELLGGRLRNDSGSVTPQVLCYSSRLRPVSYSNAR